MSPEEQAGFRERQAALDDQRRLQEAELRAMRRMLAQEARLEHHAAIRAIYANPEYGDIIRVTIQGGSLSLFGRSYRYYPVDFELARGETKKITVKRLGQNLDLRTDTAEFDVTFAPDGSAFLFNSDSFNRIVLVNRGWEGGQTYFPPEPRNPSGRDLVGASFSIEYRRP